MAANLLYYRILNSTRPYLYLGPTESLNYGHAQLLAPGSSGWQAYPGIGTGGSWATSAAGGSYGFTVPFSSCVKYQWPDSPAYGASVVEIFVDNVSQGQVTAGAGKVMFERSYIDDAPRVLKVVNVSGYCALRASGAIVRAV